MKRKDFNITKYVRGRNATIDSFIEKFCELYDFEESLEAVGLSFAEGCDLIANRSVFSELVRRGVTIDSDSIYTMLMPEEKFFVDEYCVDWDPKLAAVRSGIGGDNPTSVGRRMLYKSPIRAVVLARQQESRDFNIMSADAVKHELAKIAFSDISNYIEYDGVEISLKNLNEVDTSAIAEITQTQYGPRIKTHNKGAALEALGKAFGLFKDKLEITGKDGGSIDINLNIETLRGKMEEIVRRAASDVPSSMSEHTAEKEDSNG
jgi:phage terminase small subunit